MKIRNDNNGFIHAFLMIVLVIVGIMSAITIPQFMISQNGNGLVRIRQATPDRYETKQIQVVCFTKAR